MTVFVGVILALRYLVLIGFVCRYDKLRRRNALEIEGYQSEAAQLRGRLAHVEKLQKWRTLHNNTVQQNQQASSNVRF